MINSIISESRHKFVYLDGSEDAFSDIELKCPAVIDSSNPIVVYVKDSGMPKVYERYEGIDLNSDVIISFHRRYYELLIFSSIIDTLVRQIDVDTLNKRMERVFELCSMSSKYEINDVLTLKKYLVESKDIYIKEYYNYVQSGNTDFYDKLPIPFVIIDMLVSCLKECIELKSYFSLLLELDGDISVYNEMAVNDYIASRCNGYLSVNVILRDSEWSYYYNSNREFIQNVYDYTEVDLRKHKSRKRNVHN